MFELRYKKDKRCCVAVDRVRERERKQEKENKEVGKHVQINTVVSLFSRVTQRRGMFCIASQKRKTIDAVYGFTLFYACAPELHEECILFNHFISWW